MKMYLLIALWLVAALQSPPDPPKLAMLQIDEESVWGEGVWRPDNPTKKNEIIEGVTHYSCIRTGGRQLTRTESWCLEATATHVDGILDANVEWLKVVEW